MRARKIEFLGDFEIHPHDRLRRLQVRVDGFPLTVELDDVELRSSCRDPDRWATISSSSIERRVSELFGTLFS